MRQRLNKSRALVFLCLSAAPALVCATVLAAHNGYVDPLWTMPQIGARPYLYCVKDERQNKINRIIHDWHRADSLLMGSSRAGMVDAALFKRASVFNLSVNGAAPVELAELARMYVSHRGVPQNIYVSYDFALYADVGEKLIDTESVINLRTRERESARFSYSIDRLLDWSVVAYAQEVRETCSSPAFPNPTYHYDGRRYYPRARDDPARAATLRSQSIAFMQPFASSTWKPDPFFPYRLSSLKQAAPGARIIAFVMPVSEPLFLTKIAIGRMPDYLKFISILVDAFGEVRHFSGINSFTSDLDNFPDVHHVYPSHAEPIVKILEGRAPPQPDGFGELVTAETLQKFGDELHKRGLRGKTVP